LLDAFRGQHDRAPSRDHRRQRPGNLACSLRRDGQQHDVAPGDLIEATRRADTLVERDAG